MAQHGFRLIGALAPFALLTACSQPPQAGDTPADSTNIEISNTTPATPAAEGNLSSPSAPAPVADVGNGKWQTGIQMGLYWAAVTNAKGDAFRFTGENEADYAADRRPSFELKDKAAMGSAPATARLTVGDRSLDMPFTLEDGEAKATGTGDDVRKLIVEANGQPLCLTVSSTGYQTCFSTAEAKEAMAG